MYTRKLITHKLDIPTLPNTSSSLKSLLKLSLLLINLLLNLLIHIDRATLLFRPTSSPCSTHNPIQNPPYSKIPFISPQTMMSIYSTYCATQKSPEDIVATIYQCRLK